jgi:hypothetical protein
MYCRHVIANHYTLAMPKEWLLKKRHFLVENERPAKHNTFYFRALICPTGSDKWFDTNAYIFSLILALSFSISHSHEKPSPYFLLTLFLPDPLSRTHSLRLILFTRCDEREAEVLSQTRYSRQFAAS